MDFMRQYELNEKLSELRGEVSKIKGAIFKVVGYGKTKQDIASDISGFKNFLNGFLKEIEKYGTDVRSLASSLKCPDGCEEDNFAHEDVRKIVFVKYDYKSINDFVEGIFQGIEEGKIKDADDVEEFFERAVEMAFKLDAPTAADVIANADFLRKDRVKMTAATRAQFNQVKAYDNFFNLEDRVTIQKAVGEAIDKILEMKIEHTPGKATRCKVGAIGAVAEYINYIVTVYLVRAYLLGLYVDPVDRAKRRQSQPSGDCCSEAAMESVLMEFTNEYVVQGGTWIDGIKDTIQQVPEDVSFQPLREYQYMDLRRLEGRKAFLQLFFDFLKWAGISDTSKIPTPNTGASYSSARELPQAKFLSKLNLEDKTNQLYNLLILKEGHPASREWGPEINQLTGLNYNIEELRFILRNALTNPRHALKTEVPEKNILLHAILAADYGDSQQAIAQCAADIYTLAFHMSGGIIKVLEGLQKNFGEKVEPIGISVSPPPKDLGDQQKLSECHLLLLNFYHEFMAAIYHKLITLAQKAVDSKQGFKDNLTQMTSLNDIDILKATQPTKKTLPYDVQSSDKAYEMMQAAVPGTLRVPLELEDHFAIPVFEQAEMYDDFLRTLPAFVKDPFLTESVFMEEGPAGTVSTDTGDKPPSQAPVANAATGKPESNLKQTLARWWNKIQAFFIGLINQFRSFFRNFEKNRKYIVEDIGAASFNELTFEGVTIEYVPYSLNMERIDSSMEVFHKLLATGEFKDILSILKDPKLIPQNVDVYRNQLLFGKDAAEATTSATGDALAKLVKDDWFPTIDKTNDLIKKKEEHNKLINQCIGQLKKEIALVENPGDDVTEAMKMINGMIRKLVFVNNQVVSKVLTDTYNYLLEAQKKGIKPAKEKAPPAHPMAEELDTQ